MTKDWQFYQLEFFVVGIIILQFVDDNHVVEEED